MTMFFRIRVAAALTMCVVMANEARDLEHRDYVLEREKKNTVRPDKQAKEILQIGLDKASTKDQQELSKEILKSKHDKSHLYLGISAGITFSAVADNKHVLPTITGRIGYQNFLGISSQHIGFRITVDSFIASNIALGISATAFDDFIDTTFSFNGVSAEIVYEVPLSLRWRYAVSGGYGLGYMTYHDEYWDRMNGFSSNVLISSYLSWRDKHKIELGFRTFFYHYGSYIQRRLGSITSLIQSSNFATPISLVLGWNYVF